MKRFKLRPFKEEETPQYYWVTVYDTKEQLHKRLIKEGYDHGGCEGICRSADWYRVNEDGSEELLPCLGNIYFHKGFLGVGVVSHELMHAALRYYKKVLKYKYKDLGKVDKLGNVSEEEEDLCFLVQCLNREFWNKYNTDK